MSHSLKARFVVITVGPDKVPAAQDGVEQVCRAGVAEQVAGCARLEQAQHALDGLRGNKPLEELPLYYQLADVFVLPSVEEIWGLVVKEAAVAGLPLVVSEACGAAADLVEPGINGFRVPAASADALLAAIRDVLRDDDSRRRMGQESRRIIERCTPERAAAALDSGQQKLTHSGHLKLTHPPGSLGQYLVAVR
jgi:glycosyltransferase involved in cell wall biosynthesis